MLYFVFSHADVNSIIISYNLGQNLLSQTDIIQFPRVSWSVQCCFLGLQITQFCFHDIITLNWVGGGGGAALVPWNNWSFYRVSTVLSKIVAHFYSVFLKIPVCSCHVHCTINFRLKDTPLLRTLAITDKSDPHPCPVLRYYSRYSGHKRTYRRCPL